MTAEFVQRGRSLVEQGQLTDAVRVCRLGLVANPTELEGRLVLGSALMGLGRFDEVMAEMHSALALEPRNPSALALKGEALLRKGDAAKSLESLDLAAEGAPGDPYVEQLRTEAQANLARGRLPSVDEGGYEMGSDDIELASSDLLIDAAASEPEMPAGKVQLDKTVNSPLERQGLNPAVNERPGGQRLPSIGALFPDGQSSDEIPTAGIPYMDPPAESSSGPTPSADMKIIREGLSGTNLESKLRGGTSSLSAQEGAKPSSRGGLPIWGLAIFALVVIAGGAYGGLKIREYRLSGQIGEARANATTLTESGSFLGYQKARNIHVEIAKVRSDDDTIASLALAESALAAEFGYATESAQARVAKLGDSKSQKAQEAKVYLALAEGKGESALSQALALVAEHPGPRSQYLLGLAHLQLDQAAEALVALQEAEGPGLGPMPKIGLARAQLLEGDSIDAIETLEMLLKSYPDLPAIHIWLTRVQVAANRLPEGDEAESKLESIASASDEGFSAPSPAQAAWARLVSAEVKRHRGKDEEAWQALEEARRERVEDWMYSDLLIELLVGMGKNLEAKEEARLALEQFPLRQEPRLTLAEIALAESEFSSCLDSLRDIENAETNSRALLLRARAHMGLGALNKAAADIDRVLAERPEFPAALVVQADIELRRGDAKKAIEKLQLFIDEKPNPAASAVYASALLNIGSLDEAEEALALVSKETVSPQVEFELALARARLAEARGQRKRADRQYKELIEAYPTRRRAKLAHAQMMFQSGEVQQSGAIFDALNESQATGESLLASARANTMLGRLSDARPLLEQVQEKAPWLGWEVARERGRIFMKSRENSEAIAELQRSQGLNPDDEETRILLLESYLTARNKIATKRALADIEKRFLGRPLVPFAEGLLHYLEESPSATQSFAAALEQYEKANASPLRRSTVEYWLGRAHEVGGNLPEAEKWLKKSCEHNGANSAGHYSLGQLYHQMQKFDAMIESYKKSVEINPSEEPLAWFWMGTHFAQKGKKAQAVEALESFLKYYPEKSGDLVTEAQMLLESNR